MQLQLGLPGPWCDRKKAQKGGWSRWDCNISGELMRGGVLLSIPTRYWRKIASLGAPEKHQSGTVQNKRCSKIFGRWSRALRRRKPCCLKRGFLASPGSRVGRELAAHPIHCLGDGTARPSQIPSYQKGLSTAPPSRAGGSGLALGGIWYWWAHADTVCPSVESVHKWAEGLVSQDNKIHLGIWCTHNQGTEVKHWHGRGFKNACTCFWLPGWSGTCWSPSRKSPPCLRLKFRLYLAAALHRQDAAFRYDCKSALQAAIADNY